MPRKKKLEQDAPEAPAPRKRGRRKKAEATPATEPDAPQLPAPAAAEEPSETPPEVADADLPEVLPYAPAEAPREEPSPVTPPAQPVQSPGLAEAERKLMEKYPNVNVVVGSLRAGAAEGWGNKRVVTILCAACNRPRTVATSDVFHVRHCEECAGAAKKAARRVKRREQ
jgi:hypothetical protein